MTEHLPECPVEKRLRSGRTVGSQTCICDALRSCEERVEESMDRAWSQTVQLAVAHTRTATLDAAREAVKGVNWFNDEGKMLSAIVATADSIAAIDALREKQ